MKYFMSPMFSFFIIQFLYIKLCVDISLEKGKSAKQNIYYTFNTNYTETYSNNDNNSFSLVTHDNKIIVGGKTCSSLLMEGCFYFFDIFSTLFNLESQTSLNFGLSPYFVNVVDMIEESDFKFLILVYLNSSISSCSSSLNQMILFKISKDLSNIEHLINYQLSPLPYSCVAKIIETQTPLHFKIFFRVSNPNGLNFISIDNRLNQIGKIGNILISCVPGAQSCNSN